MSERGQRIRDLRKAKLLNQTQLAAAVGIDQSTVSDIEKGAGFSVDILDPLAGALGVTGEYLLHGSDDRFWPFAIPITGTGEERQLQEISMQIPDAVSLAQELQKRAIQAQQIAAQMDPQAPS